MDVSGVMVLSLVVKSLVSGDASYIYIVYNLYVVLNRISDPSLVTENPMAMGTAGCRRDAHGVFESRQGDQVIVNRIEVVLLGAGQRAFRVGNLSGGRIS